MIKAQKTSISNPASITTPSTTEELFGILQQRFNTITKERMLRAIEDEKEDLLYDINEELSPKTPHITNQNRFDYER